MRLAALACIVRPNQSGIAELAFLGPHGSHPSGSHPSEMKNRTIRCGFFWRSRRDSNPRYAFDVHTISSRARYDLFDTTPNHDIQFSARRLPHKQRTLLYQLFVPRQEGNAKKAKKPEGRKPLENIAACHSPVTQVTIRLQKAKGMEAL